ncbi:hypothetical protein INR49_022888 [Caranx melampygus]|nr:hypothetical protein INR49_022888 [Caranx melampygus]
MKVSGNSSRLLLFGRYGDSVAAVVGFTEEVIVTLYLKTSKAVVTQFWLKRKFIHAHQLDKTVKKSSSKSSHKRGSSMATSLFLLGIWTIEASYSDMFTTIAKTDFEVSPWCSGGDGDVYVRYGHVSGKDPPVIIPNSVRRDGLSSTGEIEMTVNMEEILSKENGPRTLDNLVGKYLYIAVLVQENGGGISQEAEFASVKFVRSPYTLVLFQTADPSPSSRQASLPLTAVAYQSTNERYIYIDPPLPYDSLEVGRQAQIKAAGLLHLYGEGTSELVADSVWMDVKASCVNGLKTNLTVDSRTYRPKEKLQLDIKTNHDGLLALSAVDTASYTKTELQRPRFHGNTENMLL